VSDAITQMVKQFVRLIAIQYGLTFCLYVRSLYEAPLHSPTSIRQLDDRSINLGMSYSVIDGLVSIMYSPVYLFVCETVLWWGDVG